MSTWGWTPSPVHMRPPEPDPLPPPCGRHKWMAPYDISASDLHPLNVSNIFVKFADDTYIISGAATCHIITDEVGGVHRWATKNNLRLNYSKSREMLIVRGGRWQVPHPPPLGNGIVRVDHMKILGATIRSGLKMTTLVDEILTACTCSLYPLRILRAHGLSGDPLFQVTRAITANPDSVCWPRLVGVDRVEGLHEVEGSQRYTLIRL